jgi:hypothetical protein
MELRERPRSRSPYCYHEETWYDDYVDNVLQRIQR